MKINKYNSFLLIITLFCLPFFGNTQIWKKLKKKAEDVVVKETVESVFKKKTNTDDGVNETGSTDSVKKSMKSNKTMDLDFGEIYILKAPNSEFEDIKMQAHKGLPKFGFLNTFRQGETDYFYNLDQEKKDKIKSMNDYFLKSYQLFKHLSAYKFEINSYDNQKLNAENIGGSSYIKMEGVKRIAFQAFSEKLVKKYFCNPQKSNCIVKKRTLSNSGKNPYFVSHNYAFNAHWGGSDATNFQQKRSFEDFKENHLQIINNWANQLWELDNKQAFFIFSIGLNRHPYDFDNEGYWIRNILSSQYTFGLGHSKRDLIKFNYQPKNRYEKEPETRKNSIFFKVSIKKAEEYENKNIKGLYIAQKVNFKSTPKGFVYHLDNPVLELFEDITLKVKAGEISMIDGLFK